MPYVAVISVAVVNLILCNFAFTTVVIVDVFLLISSYILVYISAMILRKRIPREEYKFKIPGGYPFLVVLCVIPIIIGVLSFFINGTDYFIGGLIGILTGPIMYVIWKLMYGGLAKKDPVRHPLNPRTRLAVGDLKRMAGVFFGFAVVGFLAVPWLQVVRGRLGGRVLQRDLRRFVPLGVPGELRHHADRHPGHRRGLPGDSRRMCHRRHQSRAEEGRGVATCGRAGVGVDRPVLSRFAA